MINYNPTQCNNHNLESFSNNPEQQVTKDVDAHSSSEANKYIFNKYIGHHLSFNL